MRSPLIFNLIVMPTPSHLAHGTWRMKESRSVDYTDLDFWVDLARTAEDAKLDSIFFADANGVYEDSAGNWAEIARYATQFPVADSAMLISAMAHATKNLCFAYTSTILQTHPFAFARAISTLDHLTKGRIGWNIVTSASPNAARNVGHDGLLAHEDRYRWAEEYADVTYKLWEGSWDEGAAVRDIDRHMFTDPAKVHKINHQGEHYRVEGPHMMEPSPQRMPVIFQAGGSKPGLDFAARHAEGVFMISGTPEASGARIRAVRELAVQNGRRADDLLFIEGLTIVTGDTEEAALKKAAELEEYLSEEAQFAFLAGGTGIDLSRYSLDTPLTQLGNDVPGSRNTVERIIEMAPPGTNPTVRDMMRDTHRAFRFVGSPEQVADRIEQFADQGCDGFNLAYMTLPGTYLDFIKYVAPVLRHRGLMRTEYAPGTFREKLFPGRGPTVNERHPAARYRGYFAET